MEENPLCIKERKHIFEIQVGSEDEINKVVFSNAKCFQICPFLNNLVKCIHAYMQPHIRKQQNLTNGSDLT